MTPAQEVKQDLNYVASVLRRSDPQRGVPSIYFLWAVLILAGFTLNDFAPLWSGPYWAVAGIGGGLASFALGWRAARDAGEMDMALGVRYALHWGLSGLAFVLVVLPALTQQLHIAQVVPYFLLVVGLAYVLAGVHLEPPLKWAGLLMLAGYVALVMFRLPYAWTFTGVVVGAALAYAGWQASRPA